MGRRLSTPDAPAHPVAAAVHHAAAMEAGRVLRAARQQAGLSQRALAALAGLSQSVLAEIESGRRDPRWSLVQDLLAHAGVDLQLGLPAPELTEVERGWLTLSTSRRLYWALGGRRNHRQDRTHPVWTQLGQAARGRALVLDPRLSTAVWLHEHRVPDRPVVSSPTAHDVWGRSLPNLPSLDVVVGPVATAGAIPVGVAPRAVVLAHPPEASQLQTDPHTSARLRAVAAVLHEEKLPDGQGRRGAAHRDASLDRERDVVQARHRFAGLEDPDPRDSRHWRLGGEASFREWLGRRGYEL